MLNWLRKKLEADLTEDVSLVESPSEAPATPPTGIMVGQVSPGSLEPNSANWQFVMTYANERIATLRARNDNPKLGTEKTQVIRGGIKEMKELIKILTDGGIK